MADGPGAMDNGPGRARVGLAAGDPPRCRHVSGCL